ncbi:transglycosylase SLT domain-containing protein [Nitrospirillum sp. BR 11828]|uniref:transglycosylase SLT domain-containing protein n=1 Tax=Nitrospirillum sp. BR 11828 TaxID=3104325 RepID=UPI002ACA7A99|nr:transglycosylase SLT domain-containing protein [Nitrospirillum sp. BR 11828]MDZ5649376.1 transglycosylase SLT domain-containing protein [Nitrospirillum sp. BR 11828]
MNSALSTTQLTAAQGLASSAPARIVAAVQQASTKAGVDFSYLLKQASVESGYDTNAKASTSSATGLYQFTDSTWLNMVQQHGAEVGLGQYASAIKTRSDGSAYVSDPATRQKILDLRKDPTTSAMMAAQLAQDNKTTLQQQVGGTIGGTELYLAHFLGAGGASKFLNALKKNPNQAADAVVPDAADANDAVFYDNNGKALSLGQVYDRFAKKFDGTGGTSADKYAGSTTLGTVQAADSTSQPWDMARGASSSKMPLSTYTIMMLNALAAPTEDDDQDNKDGYSQQEQRMTLNRAPNMAAAYMASA